MPVGLLGWSIDPRVVGSREDLGVLVYGEAVGMGCACHSDFVPGQAMAAGGPISRTRSMRSLSSRAGDLRRRWRVMMRPRLLPLGRARTADGLYGFGSGASVFSTSLPESTSARTALPLRFYRTPSSGQMLTERVCRILGPTNQVVRKSELITYRLSTDK